jgi:hypothetical protein
MHIFTTLAIDISKVKLYTPLCERGNEVELSYGYHHDGFAVMRAYHPSSQTTSWCIGAVDWEEEPEGYDTERAPCVEDWLDAVLMDGRLVSDEHYVPETPVPPRQREGFTTKIDDGTH